MSLSAEEKLRVAHRLDELGIHLIEAGFPTSNPKELELFELLSRETFAHAEIAAFGMTRRRDLRADEDPALRVLADCFAPVVTLVGKTWALHLEKVVQGRPRREPAHDRGVGRVPRRAGQARRLRRRALASTAGATTATTRCAACAPRPRRAPRRWSCATRTAPRCRARSPRRSPTSSRDLADTGVQVGIHCHDDLACGVANSLAAVEAGATHVQGTMNGYGERCGNANLVSIVPNLQLKLGHECLPPTHSRALTETAHFLDELLNRTPNPTSRTSARTRSRTGAACTSPACWRDPTTFEHIDPELVGNSRELLISELSGKGTVRARAEAGGPRARRRGGAPRDRARQGAGARRLPVRGRRRLVRAAAAQGVGRVRAAVPARVVARDRREARRRQGRDRGDDQDLGRRRALRAHGRGQRPGARARQRAALGDRREPPAAARHRARQLQGPHPRRDEGHRARSRACCSTPPTATTCGARSASRRT